MSDNHNYCVILAGGIGSRFWPISRADKPKQFLSFEASGSTFLRQTYDRVKLVVPEENIIVVSLTRYRDMVLEQIPELKEENLLLEPYNRNTAPCICFATYHLLKRDPLAIVMSTPADHLIKNEEGFARTLRRAMDYAGNSDDLITIGVTPTRPDANFGYIQMSGFPEGGKPVKVKTFTEKPDKELASVFIASGEFLWNSGIFVWRASAIREEMETHAPEITSLWKGWKDILETPEQESFIQKVYTDMPRISIDYAVMEKTEHAKLFTADFDWADIGNWDSLHEYLAVKDENGNALGIQGKLLMADNREDIIYSQTPGKLIAVRGLDNFVVIDTDDVLMICPRDSAKLKDFISEIAMPEYEEFR